VRILDSSARKLETQPIFKPFPLSHEKINEWKDPLRGGITFGLDGSNVIVTGGVDDMWVSPEDEYIVVDYKSTAKASRQWSYPAVNQALA